MFYSLIVSNFKVLLSFTLIIDHFLPNTFTIGNVMTVNGLPILRQTRWEFSNVEYILGLIMPALRTETELVFKRTPTIPTNVTSVRFCHLRGFHVPGDVDSHGACMRTHGFIRGGYDAVPRRRGV